MDPAEKEICRYLKSSPDKFVSGREIARRAGGKWRFREDPNWAMPVLLGLVEQNILEADASGSYRLRARTQKAPKKFLSPQMRAILEKSGKRFGDLLDVDEQEDLFE